MQTSIITDKLQTPEELVEELTTILETFGVYDLSEEAERKYSDIYGLYTTVAYNYRCEVRDKLDKFRYTKNPVVKALVDELNSSGILDVDNCTLCKKYNIIAYKFAYLCFHRYGKYNREAFKAVKEF